MTDNTGGNNSASGSTPDGAVAGPSRSATTETSNTSRPNAAYSFPPAFQPSIIRSFQKDAYYLSLFKAQFIDVARTVIGTRALQTHSDKLALVAAIAYHVFTTWEGAQTLGEEYVGSRMVARPRSGGTSRFVSRSRRVAFILTQVLLPFVLSRFYAAARRRINVSHQLRSQALQRAQMRARAVQSEEEKGDASKAPHPSRLDRIVGGLSRTLPSLEDLNRADGWLSYATAIHLMLFYLGGKYYKIAQRLVRVRYISIHPSPPGQEPPSYEVLGVLLGVQLGVKSALSLNRYLHRRAAAKKEAQGGHDDDQDQSPAARKAEADATTVEIDDRLWSHASVPAKPLRTLHNEEDEEREEDFESKTDFTDLAPLGQRVPLAFPSSTGNAVFRGYRASDAKSDETLSTAQLRAAPLESSSSSLLQCTLCMDQRKPQMGTSAVTECGHCFDWTCIVNWLKEKSECPLCRRQVALNRVIPIYNI
ncbi:unnamed protein product [Jaminaea pallidilutea]